MLMSCEFAVKLFILHFLTLVQCAEVYFPFDVNVPVDPEVYQDVYEIIDSKGYSAREYVVQTDDGYYLTLQRIVPKQHYFKFLRKTVLLQHGLLDSAHTWINNLANESLGFVLADAGFDVWLGNSRGSTYSQSHDSLDPTEEPFWEFSWDEMAHFDLPAVINFILNVTGEEKIFYVGHSQGTQIAFARLNFDFELRSKISAFAALAPVAYLGNVRSPIRYLATICKEVDYVANWLGKGKFMPSSSLVRYLGLLLCRTRSTPFICSNIIFLLAGYNEQNTNYTRLPVYVAHTPAGTSVQNIAHYCQSMTHGRFQAQDFGKAKNKRVYNQTTPPIYSVSSMHLPMRLYWGGNDWLATTKDVQRILDELPKDKDIMNMYIPHYNHLDFVWGLDAANLVYSDIIQFFRGYQ